MKSAWIKTWLLFMAVSSVGYSQTPLDELNLGGGQTETGQSIDLPIYFRDVAGSQIDRDINLPNAGFAGFGFGLTFDGSLIDSLDFELGGHTLTTPFSAFVPQVNLSEGRAWLTVAFNPEIPVTVGTAFPGELTAYLRITPSAAAAGREIIFSIENSTTFIQGGSLEVADLLRVDDGNMAVNLGSLVVTGSGGTAPSINSFSVAPQSIFVGESATLSWSTADAATVSISSVGVVAESGSIDVSPSETATYTLLAENEFGSRQQSVTVQVLEGDVPRIVSFVAADEGVLDGGSTTLTWEVENATNVTLTEVGTVDSNGSASVSPSQTTTYTLSASNASGSSSAQVDVMVYPELRIEEFFSSRSRLIIGEGSLLRWVVTGADSVVLNPGQVEVQAEDSLFVTPTDTTEYVLSASGPLDQVATSSRTIEVVTDPTLLLDVTQLDFDDDNNNLFVNLDKNTSGSADWSVVGVPEWLTLSESEGTLSSSRKTLTLTVDRSRFFPGRQATAQLTFSAEQHADAVLDVNVSRAAASAGKKVLYFPLVEAGDDRSSTLSVTNGESDDVLLALQLFDAHGLLQGQELEMTLSSRQTHLETVENLPDGRGWAAVTVTLPQSNRRDLKVFGIQNTRTLDGEQLYSVSAVEEAGDSLIVPHIALNPVFSTVSSVLNLASDPADLSFAAGSFPDFDLGNTDAGSQSFFDYRQALGDDTLDGGIFAGWGNLSMGQNAAMVGMEVFSRVSGPDFPDLKQSVGVNLSSEAANELYFVHIAQNTAAFWTGIVMINTSSRAAQVQVEAYSVDGVLLDTVSNLSFAAGEKKTFLVLGDSLPFGEGAAWLKVTGDRPLAGYELFGTFENADVFAGFEAVTHTGRRLILPHIEDAVKDGSFTGVALVNPQDVAIEISMELFSAAGESKQQIQKTVGAKQKIVDLISTLFTANIEVGDTVLVTSDQPIAGFELFGFSTRTMGAIIAPVHN